MPHDQCCIGRGHVSRAVLNSVWRVSCGSRSIATLKGASPWSWPSAALDGASVTSRSSAVLGGATSDVLDGAIAALVASNVKCHARRCKRHQGHSQVLL